jgi:hypothetical protein
VSVVVDDVPVDVVSVVVVVSVDDDVVSVVAAVDVSVAVVSVLVPLRLTIPNAPDATKPAPSSAANATTNLTRRSAVRPFTSPAPLLPRCAA